MSPSARVEREEVEVNMSLNSSIPNLVSCIETFSIPLEMRASKLTQSDIYMFKSQSNDSLMTMPGVRGRQDIIYQDRDRAHMS
jgi:hypothetical protein